MANTVQRTDYDLHTHSVYSDGTTTPQEIVELAAQIGLHGIALTDHDTTDGWREAREHAARLGIDFLPGIEITTRDGSRSTHLLAYGIDPHFEPLQRELEQVRVSRVTRAQTMVQRLSADFLIDWASIVGAEDARTVGRPHIADALVTAGYYRDRSEAFTEVLRPSSQYYVSTHAIDTEEAIALVRAAGGVPVLAHPAAIRQSGPVTREALERFTAAGLWGLELAHPENKPEWIHELTQTAADLGLVGTGASDFHGAGKPNRLGDCVSDAEIVAQIRAEAAVPR